MEAHTISLEGFTVKKLLKTTSEKSSTTKDKIRRNWRLRKISKKKNRIKLIFFIRFLPKIFPTTNRKRIQRVSSKV